MNLERNNKSGKCFFEEINKIDTYWQDCSRKREKSMYYQYQKLKRGIRHRSHRY